MNTEVARSGFHQQVMSGLGSHRRPVTGVRMTPMIDVIFLLLTFFVLTAQFRQEEKILPIVVPKAAAPASAEQKTIKVYLEHRGSYAAFRIEGRPEISTETIPQEDALLLFAQKLRDTVDPAQSLPVEIWCDDRIDWDTLVKAYDIIYAFGGSEITFRYRE